MDAPDDRILGQAHAPAHLGRGQAFGPHRAQAVVVLRRPNAAVAVRHGQMLRLSGMAGTVTRGTDGAATARAGCAPCATCGTFVASPDMEAPMRPLSLIATLAGGATILAGGLAVLTAAAGDFDVEPAAVASVVAAGVVVTRLRGGKIPEVLALLRDGGSDPV
jgi:hypothetical protein